MKRKLISILAIVFQTEIYAKVTLRRFETCPTSRLMNDIPVYAKNYFPRDGHRIALLMRFHMNSTINAARIVRKCLHVLVLEWVPAPGYGRKME